MTTAAFETLPLPTKALPPGLEEGVYKIYKTRDEFVPVKAHSALEAIKNSGIENIYRVERDSLDKNYLLNFAKATEMLFGQEQPAATAAPAAEAAAAPVETPKA